MILRGVLISMLIGAPAPTDVAPVEESPTGAPSKDAPFDLDVEAAEAQKAFDAGDYDRVVEIAERAYAISGSLAFLYAQAHAERFRGNCQKALGLYGRVIAAAPDGPYAAVAREGIMLCEQQASEEPEPEPEPIPAPSVEPTPPSPPPPKVDEAPRRPDALGTVLLTVGTASLATGVALFISSAAASERARRADDETRFSDDRARARAFSIGGTVASSAAGILLSASIVRFVRVRRSRSVAVDVDAGFVGLRVSSTF